MGTAAGCNLNGRAGGHPEDREVRFLTGVYELFPTEILLRRSVVELDLGCGVGSFTAELAKRYPERTILAADVMIGRLRKLVRRMHRMKLENLTLLRSEARFLVGFSFPDGALDRIHLLCPDPWPKGRHRGHRLLASDFTAQLHRVLKPEAQAGRNLSLFQRRRGLLRRRGAGHRRIAALCGGTGGARRYRRCPE